MKNTEWYKEFILDEQGKPYSSITWRVTTKSGVVYKGYTDGYKEVREVQSNNTQKQSTK